MATNNPAGQGQPSQPQLKRAEMYFLDLAKSKVVQFAGKSCELVIFFGCLWITLVMTTPDAVDWLHGGINSFFLTSMGFAVDAAFPESWLHVCTQYLDKKWNQFKWSVVIALAMLVLVAINGVTAGAESILHISMPAWFLAAVIIMRLLIGIGYVAIRECQSVIDRRTEDQHQVIPIVDVVAHLNTFTETINQRFSELKSETEQRLQMSETRLSEALARLTSESENRFSETLQALCEDLGSTFTESLQPVIRSQVQAELHPVYDALQGYASILEALAALPSQQAQLSVIVREVKATVERIPSFTESQAGVTERPRLLSLKAKTVPAVKAEESFTEASVKETGESSFDKKAFVVACLTENAAMTIGDIQRRAEAAGQSVSAGYISGIRKALAGEDQSA